MKEKNISHSTGFAPWSPGTESQCATKELCWPPLLLWTIHNQIKNASGSKPLFHVIGIQKDFFQGGQKSSVFKGSGIDPNSLKDSQNLEKTSKLQISLSTPLLQEPYSQSNKSNFSDFYVIFKPCFVHKPLARALQKLEQKYLWN